MKIAILTSDARDHDRTYAETVPRFNAGVTSFFEGFAKRPEVELHVLSCIQKSMEAPEKIAPNIWYHGLHVPKIGWLRTGYQGCIRAVRRRLREIQPDIVHGLGTERDCSISAVLSGFPNVVTIHGNMAELARLNGARIGNYYWLTAHIENFTLRRTAGVLCNSTYTENLVRPRTRKTWLLPHALRQAFLEPVPDAGTRPCVILNAGVISPRKRQLELLDVAEALHRKGLKFEMHFIGFIYSQTDPYAMAFLKRIQPMEAAGYARFLGPQPTNDLVNCFDSVSAMVHFPTEEAFGNVVMEALARNLKFFGARLGGIVDIAQAAPGGELFDGEDWAGLTDAMARWIERGYPRPTEAAAFVRQRYTSEVIVRRHLEIYREVLGRKS
ncbi:MAG: glycosyltransferase family 4 protein [Limisphaerales bacterium]